MTTDDKPYEERRARFLLTRRSAIALGVMAAMTAGCATRPRRAKRWRANRARPIGDFPEDQFLEQYRARSGVSDFSVRVLKDGRTLYARDVGDYGPSTQINIASASKWFVGAAAMAQVDAGRFRLEDRIGDYVRGLPAGYAALRLDQLLSFTAGLPSLKSFAEFRQPENIPLAESARLAAQKPLASAPGTRFNYGGANLQFVGAAIEAVNGMSWHEVFRRDIAGPLGMRNTLWGRMKEHPSPHAPVANPVLQAGAWSTANDYASFLGMIAQDGIFMGRRVLTKEGASRLASLSTLGIKKDFTAPGAEGRDVEYLLAHWCESVAPSSGRPECSFESSPGFYGTYPWIDRRTGVYGVILQKDRLQRVADETRALRDKLIAHITAKYG